MEFILATKEDKVEIMKLYRDAIGSDGCTWSMEYPSDETFESDICRESLFCMKTQQGEIVGAISIDDDRLVQELSCWNKSLYPMAELARLVVKETYRNQGIAPQLIEAVMPYLEKRGFQSAGYLLSKRHIKALQAYRKLEFVRVGECDLYEHDWWCYQKRLGSRFSGIVLS